MSRAPRIIICGLAVCLLSGCVGTTPHAQIRTVAVNDPWGKDILGNYVDTTNLPNEALTNKIGERIVESYNEFDLSFVEFDDQGKFWNRDQQLGALDKLADDPQAKQRGAVILVFVHGWQENADVANPTVACFRQMLHRWSQDEGDDGRRILGVYVGWRGRSQQLPILTSLTFWPRKKAAHKIGRGDMDELLVHLDDLKRRLSANGTPGTKAATRLVVIGHSFGGAIVFSALDNILKKNTLASVLPFEHGETNKVGLITAGSADLVVLLNPAFETLLYSGLAHATMGCTNFDPEQTTLLMTIGAQNDSATGTAFPVGQFFPSLLQNFKGGSDERVMNRTALGHYTRYFDCQLSSNAGTNASPDSASVKSHKPIRSRHYSKADKEHVRTVTAETKPNYGICAMLHDAFPDSQWKLTPLQRQMGPPDPPVNSPFLVITATPDIVDNHTGIWGDPLGDFIRNFIEAHDARKAQFENATPAQKTP
jgi:pimeloyl-ACP methyl ester carboxylesterase